MDGAGRTSDDPHAEQRAAAARTLLLAVVAGGAIAGASIGIRHVHGLFLLPMTFDRGWSRETFGFALALQNLCWGFAQPLAGLLADRFGASRVLAFGVLLYGASLAALSTVTSIAGLNLAAGVGIGVAQACTAFGTVYAALNRLAPEARRGGALGLAGAIGSTVQFVAVPATHAALETLGWPATLLALGATLAALLPATALLREPWRRPPGATATTAGRVAHVGPSAVRPALAAALRHRGFLLLVAGFAACGLQLAFIANHLPAYLRDHGIDARVAVIGLGLIALANIPGTYACGRLGDAFPAPRVLAALYTVRAGVLLAFGLLPKTPATTYAFCLAMGALWLGTLPLTNATVLRLFGVRHIGTLFGIAFCGHQIGAFFGAWLGGWFFDRWHSYDAMGALAIVVGLIAAAANAAVDERAAAPVPAPHAA